MYILKNIGPEISIKVLISALKNKDRSVRCEAARALGQIGDKRAVEPLIESLKRHESELVWRSPLVPTPKSLPRRMEGHSITNRAAAALGNIGDKRAVKPLIKALEDNLGHRAASYSVIIFIKALEKIGDKRAVKPLIKVLDFTRSSLVHGLYFTIQLKAISALGNMGDKRAIEPITNFLNKNQDWGSCQLTGKEALEKLK